MSTRPLRSSTPKQAFLRKAKAIGATVTESNTTASSVPHVMAERPPQRKRRLVPPCETLLPTNKKKVLNSLRLLRTSASTLLFPEIHLLITTFGTRCSGFPKEGEITTFFIVTTKFSSRQQLPALGCKYWQRNVGVEMCPIILDLVVSRWIGLG